MKKIISVAIMVLFLFTIVFPNAVSAHSGRTDSSGGHNCSAKSISKGLCTGYHYHNGGTSSGSSSSQSSSSGSSSSSKSSSGTKSTTTKTTNQSSSLTDSGKEYHKLNMNLYVDNQYMSLQKKLIIIQDVSYIYVRDFAKAFGYSMEFDKSKDLIFKKKTNIIKIDSKTNQIYFNNKNTGVKAVKAAGNYYLPLRAAVGWAQYKIKSVDSTAFYVTSK